MSNDDNKSERRVRGKGSAIGGALRVEDGTTLGSWVCDNLIRASKLSANLQDRENFIEGVYHGTWHQGGQQEKDFGSVGQPPGLGLEVNISLQVSIGSRITVICS